ncbi:uncharacterized protein LOC111053591 isoform X2 [Nilaparvata lugens]|uniref:uncharacterized protein LOC111053591 isoform X2 n=1 Tax=Nilaparvata lugens TaxID=108931 RepID=UPI00193DB071|nr:uncharacterized protein LOC111053591 isoform X2 [Nilaparvata lugens]
MSHNIPLELFIQTNNCLSYYSSISEFLEWKSKMELETHSSYFRRAGVISTSGTKHLYYHCSRTGRYKPVEVRQRKLKSQGTAKLETKCPSRLVVREGDQIYVKFFDKHEGHGTDLKHIRLPLSIREYVVGKLKEGVAMKQILEDIREEAIAKEDMGLASMITKKLVRNIKNSCEFTKVKDSISCERGEPSESIMNTEENAGIFIEDYLDMNNIPSIEEHFNHQIVDGVFVIEQTTSENGAETTQYLHVNNLLTAVDYQEENSSESAENLEETTEETALEDNNLVAVEYEEVAEPVTSRRQLVNECTAILTTLRSLVWDLSDSELSIYKANLKTLLEISLGQVPAEESLPQ